MRHTDQPDMVTTQELACFAYCPERWRLRYGLGFGPGRRPDPDPGRRRHDRRARPPERVTLTSRRHGLTGRAARLIRTGGTLITEGWANSRRPRPWDRAEMGALFLLVEDQLGVTPPHGLVVGDDGARHRVANDAALRAWVLELAGRVRAARAATAVPIQVRAVPGRCFPCGVWAQCEQSRL